LKLSRENIVKFKDEQLQKRVDHMMSFPVGNLPDDQRPIFALMDAYEWFHRIDGGKSPRVDEVIETLLSPELRPALQSWYKRWGDKMNPAATDFREHLSKLAREKFG
jgi:hypothetical protein